MSQNDTWQIYRNPNQPVLGTGNVVTATGNLILTDSQVVFGQVLPLIGPVGGGDLRINQTGNLSLTNTDVTTALDWGKNSIDGWDASRISISGGTYTMFIRSEPNPIPAGRRWDVLTAADQPITGTFGTYLLGPNYNHEFNATRRFLRIKT